MRELTSMELQAVSGGELSHFEAAVITVGLMALAMSSPAVIAAGSIALLYYAWC